MGYVVVVFAIINAAALLAVGYYLRELWRALPMYITTAMGDEVRKQDDRIEKRIARAVDAPENNTGLVQTADGRVQSGRPLRR